MRLLAGKKILVTGRKKLLAVSALVTGVVAVLLFFVGYSQVTVNGVEIMINFFLPMKTQRIPAKIKAVPEYPATRVSFQAAWVNSRTLVLRLKQRGYPEGQLLNLAVEDAPSLIPLVNKNVRKVIRLPAPLRLVSPQVVKNVPSQGPVEIIFNSPVDEQTLNRLVTLPEPGKIQPIRWRKGGKSVTDYSRWRYFPDKPFQHQKVYRLGLKKGIRNLSGGELPYSAQITLTIADPPRVRQTVPAAQQKQVTLYRTVECLLDQEVWQAMIKVSDQEEDIVVPGRTIIEGTKVVFKPERAFLPGKVYKVTVQADSINHEPMAEYEFSFTTVDMGEKYWADIKLGVIHTVKVYRGRTLVRYMVASGGKGDTPTPLGHFYTQDRGYSFWSPKFGEGATYWVRLVGQVLIHSVPRDSRWQVKDDEHAKLGLPASHGCIRLDDKDARWFYETIPQGALVIIHD